MKQSYEIHPIQETIKWAIQIYIEEYGRVTPTEVLRFAKFEENKAMRTLVLEVAESMEYTVKSSGRGYIIVDTPIETMPLKEYEVAYKVRYPSWEADMGVMFFDCFAPSSEVAYQIFMKETGQNDMSGRHQLEVVSIEVIPELK